jgi:hypothetical protein
MDDCPALTHQPGLSRIDLKVGRNQQLFSKNKTWSAQPLMILKRLKKVFRPKGWICLRPSVRLPFFILACRENYL